MRQGENGINTNHHSNRKQRSVHTTEKGRALKDEREVVLLALLSHEKNGTFSNVLVRRTLDDCAGKSAVEKAYEEFYVPGEKINMERFKALGVVEETTRRPMEEVNAFFAKLEMLFADDFTKEDVVKAIKEFIPNFEHEEKGKNLDQKM